MRSRILTVALVLVAFFGVAYFSDLTAFSSVPPTGRTGSPSDGNSCVGCHGGSPVVNLNGVIETDIPVEGYTPGETYTITIASGASRDGAQRYGFQLSPQDDLGNTVGTLIQVSGTNVSNDGKYISHNGAQSTVSPDWSFQWTAPDAGTGSFSFYLSVVAADGTGNTSGDEVVLSSLEVTEGLITSSNNITVNRPKVFATKEIISIEHPNVEQVLIYDVNGKLAFSSSAPSAITDISTFESGMYIVTIKAEGKWFREKIIK